VTEHDEARTPKGAGLGPPGKGLWSVRYRPAAAVAAVAAVAPRMARPASLAHALQMPSANTIAPSTMSLIAASR